VELRPLDASHDALLRSLEEQEDVWEFVGPLLLPQEGSHLFAIVEAGVPIGVGGLVPSPHVRDEVELVCALLEPAQLRGLALRACQLLLAWAFDTARLERVITVIDAHNQGARSVALKLGMRESETLPQSRTVYVKDRDRRT
jgi:RimJ/RimL family protein N-acetyltransferase